MSKGFLRPCIECGKLSRGGSRCEIHQKIVELRADERKRSRKLATGQYSGDYQRRAKAVRESASVCHLCGEGARADDPWQADHVIAGDPRSPLAAAHRSCNASRGNKPIV